MLLLRSEIRLAISEVAELQGQYNDIAAVDLVNQDSPHVIPPQTSEALLRRNPGRDKKVFVLLKRKCCEQN
jgi:hypothetical protein